MTPEKNDKKLTRWLLIATIALLVLVLVVALAVFLIRWLHFARKRRRYGKGTKW